jgi:hypothetical protein
MTIGDALFDASQNILFYVDSGHCFHPDDLPEISEVMLAMERLQLRLDYGLDPAAPAPRRCRGAPQRVAARVPRVPRKARDILIPGQQRHWCAGAARAGRSCAS